MVDILFFGDFVATNASDIVLSDEIKVLISKSDVVGCNLEAPITTKVNGIQKSGMPIKQHKETARWLEVNGFNVIQIANNHILDFGVEGLVDTLEELENFVTIGAGNYEQAYLIKEVKIKNKKIGFISFSHYEFGITENENQSGVAWINHPRVFEDIRKNKALFDFVIALPHAGIELIDAPLPEWKLIYKILIDSGVDAIIATHPHIPQGWEVYNGKPIFYSLGNFYFDAVNNSHPYWNKSYAVQILLDDKITFRIHNLIFSEGNIKLDMNPDRDKHNQYLCDLIQDIEKYHTYIDEQAIRLFDHYVLNMKLSLGSIYLKGNYKQKISSIITLLKGKKDYNFLLNVFRCESHRWLIQRALILKMK